jgi:hypothetical protein
MLKETTEYTIHGPFFLKFKIKISLNARKNKEARGFFFLFHKQSEPVNCLNPKQQGLMELRKT